MTNDANPVSTRRGDCYGLVVMPDPEMRRICSEILRGEGLQIVAVEDGQSVKAVVASHGAPRIVVTELSLPIVDGFAMIAALRQRFSPAETAVVVLSAFEEMRNSASEQRERLGIAWVVAKETGDLLLSHAVHEALDGSESPRSDEASAAPSEPRHRDPQCADRVQRMVDKGPPDEVLQTIVADTAKMFSVPVAMVSLVLSDRHWFKAHYGLGGELLEQRGTPVAKAFCRHVVDAGETLVVPDATNHPSFRNNELVRSGAVGSYAGAPLVAPNGDVLGTLCIIDNKPLGIDADKMRSLEALARHVVGEIQRAMDEQRETSSHDFLQSALSFLSRPFGGHDSAVVLFGPDGHVQFTNDEAAARLGAHTDDILGKSRKQLLAAIAVCARDPAEFVIRLGNPSGRPFSFRGEFELLRPTRRIRWIEEPLPGADGTGQVCFVVDAAGEQPGADSADSCSDRMVAPTQSLPDSTGAMLREVARAATAGTTVQLARIRVSLPRCHKQGLDEATDRAQRHAFHDVGDILRDYALTDDLVLPWGPNEYLAVLPRSDKAAAEAFRARVQRAVHAHDFEIGSVDVFIGTAELHPGADLHEVLNAAGEKLYEQSKVGAR